MGDHKVVLSGESSQEVRFSDPGTSTGYNGAGSHFNQLEITNTSPTGVDFVTSTPVVRSLKATSSSVQNSKNLNLHGAQLIGGDWQGDLTYSGVTLATTNVVHGDVYASGLNLGGNSLTVNGMLIVNSGTLDLAQGSLTTPNGVEHNGGSVVVSGGTFSIGGDYWQKGGTLDLTDSSFSIPKSYVHSGGTLFLGSGSLSIAGDYRGQSLSFDDEDNPIYLDGRGVLRMTDPLSYMLVNGDFIQDSLYGGSLVNSGGNSNFNGYSLLNGVLELKGNFEQRSSSGAAGGRYCNRNSSGSCPTFNKRYTTYYGLHNFRAMGDHKVVLSGESSQEVRFSDPGTTTGYNGAGSHFNQLEITNTSLEGIDFVTNIFFVGIFQHNQNAFWLQQSGSFVDFDADGVKDNLDSHPLDSTLSDFDFDDDDLNDNVDPDDDNDDVHDIDDCSPFDEAIWQLMSGYLDFDGDGLGAGVQEDVCSGDDLLITHVSIGGDNCPLTANLDQIDTDEDGFGDVCDLDDDNDGEPDESDNCLLLANSDQLNFDQDLFGDVCDDDDDNDLVLDDDDAFPFDATESSDFDMDGQGDNADSDDDGDNVEDVEDNCLFLSNQLQTDTDSDLSGDACDSDDDNDGIDDAQDIDSLNPRLCLDVDNDLCDDCSIGVDQFGPADDFDDRNDGLDSDSNGQCNVTDTDDDGDGIIDENDNCPLVANLDQLDEDGYQDGFGEGDACEDRDDGICIPIKTKINTVAIICL
jgi:hypothetical protein